MTGDTSPPSPPGQKQRGTKIRRFVKRVTSFANIRPNARDSKGSFHHDADAVQEFPSHLPVPQSDTHLLHDGPLENHLQPPPSLTQIPSSSSSATATVRTQTTLVSPARPRRDDDANSLRSGELSDSQESSFSGLSALPSNYGQSTTASPEQAKPPSLEHQLSPPAPLDSFLDIGPRVDSCVITSVDELTRILAGPRDSIYSDFGLNDATAQPEKPVSHSHDSDRAETEHTPVAQSHAANTLQLDVTPQAEEVNALEDIPALQSLTQLDSKFGADQSSSILCPMEPVAETIAVAETFARESAVSQEMEQEGSPERDLPLPLEPTLPAVSEASSGADPDFLDLDLPSEADVYAVGQPDNVGGAVDSVKAITELAVAESSALAVPLESAAAEDSATLATTAVTVNEMQKEVGFAPPSAEDAQHEEITVGDKAIDIVDERPVIEACPPPELEEVIRKELPSSTPSEIYIPLEETAVEDNRTPLSEIVAEWPVIEPCPLAEVEEYIRQEIPSSTHSVRSVAIEQGAVEESDVPESENALERPVIELCPPPEMEAFIRQELPSSTPSEMSFVIEELKAEDVSVSENVLERPVIEPCPPAELDAIIREELPSSSPSVLSLLVEEAPISVAQREIAAEPVFEIAAERPVIEPCPPAEVEALIAADIPSIPLSATTTEAPTPAEDSYASGRGVEATPVDSLMEEIAATQEVLVSSGAEIDEGVAENAEKPKEEPCTFAPSAMEGSDMERQAPLTYVEDAAAEGTIVNAAPDHIEERPVLERYPTIDDDHAIAAIAETLPPAEAVDAAYEADTSASFDSFDGPDAEPDGSASFIHDGKVGPESAAEEPTGNTSDATVCDGNASPAAKALEATPAEPADASYVTGFNAGPKLPGDRDLPELIPSIPSSSNSSEYGDELEDPPYPESAVIVPSGPKHLPLATRDVHLSLGYSLTWWLSKHPMF